MPDETDFTAPHPPGEESVPPEELASYQPLDAASYEEPGDADEDPFKDEPVLEEGRQGVALTKPDEPATERLLRLREKAKLLKETPGVYLMKDAKGIVIYVGKSKSLRDRVGSYFVRSADLGSPAKQLLLDYVSDFDTVPCDSDVAALLTENRLIKDIHPRFNADMRDGKSYPYLEITTRDDYPGVYITRQPRSNTKLYGPFTSIGAVKEALTHLQRIFKFRTCHLDILEADQKKRFFRPCLLYGINQCTAPCADKISKDAYRQDVDRLKRFLDTKGTDMLREMTAEMEAASKLQDFEHAAKLRDQIRAMRALSERSRLGPDKSIQHEVFFQDHRSGLKSLQDLLELPEPIRSIECIDIAHLQGEATVGSLVCFIDGRPFKNGYRRFRIKTVAGIDDYRSIQEVVSRRYREAGQNAELYPDVILIDGGLGQLHAAQEAFAQMDVRPPMVISLAKREEEIYIQARQAPIKLSRTNAGLKLLQHIRDEAHRFGQNYHHLLIHKRRFEEEVAAGKRPLKARKKKSQPSSAPTDPDFKVLSHEEIAQLKTPLDPPASDTQN